MSKCIYCEEKLSERGAFCKACGEQSKCTNCNEQLEAQASFCVTCGAKTGQSSKESTQRGPASNTFEFTETKTSRSAKAVLTDEAVANLQDTLSLVVSSYPLGTIPRPSSRLPHASNGQQDLFQDDGGDASSDGVISVTHRTLPATGNQTVEDIKSLFYLDGDNLVLEVQDLKASGQKDFGVRLAYLRMLYAKDVEEQEFLPRDDLNTTIKEVMGALDPHVVNWISTTTDLSIKDENGKAMVRLRGDGRKKALECLAEVFDPSRKGSYVLEKKGKAGSKSQNSKADTNGQAKSGSQHPKNKDVEGWISKWKDLNLTVDLQGIAKGLGQLDRVVIGLWLIHKVTSGNVDTAKTTKIAPLLTDLFFVPAGRGNLNKALKDGYKDMLLKTPDGWRITPEGLKRAENFVNNSGKGN